MTTESTPTSVPEANIPEATLESVSTMDELVSLLTEPDTTTAEETEAPDTTESEELEEPTPDTEEAETPEEETPVEDEATLAQMLGLTDDQIDTDEEGNLILNTKVDGETTRLNFKEVLAGFQTQKHNTQKSQALAEERKVFETQVQVKANEFKQQLDTNTALASQLYNELIAEYKNTDWNTLRQTDPAEWSARQQDMQNRNSQIQQVTQSIAQQRQAGEAQLQEKAQEVQTNYLAQQRDLMITANPDWSDPEHLKTGLTEIKTYLGTVGFNEDDMANIQDARAISIIQDAMAFRAGKKVADKKIKAIPKVIKSTGKKANSVKTTRLDKLTKAAKTAKGANRIKLQDAALAELFTG